MKSKKSLNFPLDKFINFSLYNKKFGYYMKKNPFGKRGDFITAPNISRLFTEMIAIWIISFWKSLGSPKKFNLIELGAGNGEMMKVLSESFENFPDFLKSCNFIIHEKSPLLIKEQKKKLQKIDILWKSKLDKIKKIPSIFIANEFFDAMPIKQFQRKNKDISQILPNQSKCRKWKDFAPPNLFEEALGQFYHNFLSLKY